MINMPDDCGYQVVCILVTSVVAECSMLVRQPPEMSDRQELCGVWVAQVELTCRQIVDVVGCHG